MRPLTDSEGTNVIRPFRDERPDCRLPLIPGVSDTTLATLSFITE